VERDLGRILRNQEIVLGRIRDCNQLSSCDDLPQRNPCLVAIADVETHLA